MMTNLSTQRMVATGEPANRRTGEPGDGRCGIFSGIQSLATKADHRRVNKLGLSTAKLIGGSNPMALRKNILADVERLARIFFAKVRDRVFAVMTQFENSLTPFR
jgi:hypothetical protein